MLLLGATLAATKVAEQRTPEPLSRPLSTLSQDIAGFSATENAALTEGVLGQLKPTDYLSRTYRHGNVSLDLFVAYYASQRAGESMHSPKHCLPGAGWEIWNYGTAAIPVNGGTVNVNNYSISGDGRRMVVLYWYQSKSRIVASEYEGKVFLAKDALLHNSTAGSIVRIIIPDNPTSLAAARVFASSLIPELRRLFSGDARESAPRAETQPTAAPLGR